MNFRKFHQSAIALSIAVSAVAISSSPGMAFSQEAQQMCTGDAMRLCGSEIPSIPRIIACMHRERAHVSPGCRAVMQREAAAARRSRRAYAE
jgi:hypothetical protein